MRDSGRLTESKAKPAITVERAGQEALREVFAWLRTCADGPHWPQDAWLSSVEPQATSNGKHGVLLLARTAEGTLAGWLAGGGVSETAELEFVHVHPSQRGCGVGGHLLEAWLRWCRDRKAEQALLEVRASNTAAILLYQKLGFAQQGVRRRYYQNPTEDAILMRRALDGTDPFRTS